MEILLISSCLLRGEEGWMEWRNRRLRQFVCLSGPPAPSTTERKLPEAPEALLKMFPADDSLGEKLCSAILVHKNKHDVLPAM